MLKRKNGSENGVKFFLQNRFDTIILVRQQTEGDRAHGQAGTGLPEEPDKAVVILGVVEDLGAAIAPVQGMVAKAAQVSAGRTWHAGIVYRLGEYRKRFFTGIPARLRFLLFL